jgi:hypothetical protein
MSTLMGASESDDPGSSAPWHVLPPDPLVDEAASVPDAALLTDDMISSLDLLYGVAQPRSCCCNATCVNTLS